VGEKKYLVCQFDVPDTIVSLLLLLFPRSGNRYSRGSVVCFMWKNSAQCGLGALCNDITIKLNSEN